MSKKKFDNLNQTEYIEEEIIKKINIDKIFNNNLKNFYEEEKSNFIKSINRLNIQFYLETENLKNNKNINKNNKEFSQNKLFLILFKQINIYISEIEKLNTFINNLFNSSILPKEEKEKINRKNIEIEKLNDLRMSFSQRNKKDNIIENSSENNLSYNQINNNIRLKEKNLNLNMNISNNFDINSISLEKLKSRYINLEKDYIEKIINEKNLNDEIKYLKRNLSLYVDKLKIDIKSSKARFENTNEIKNDVYSSFIKNVNIDFNKYSKTVIISDDNINLNKDRDKVKYINTEFNNYNKIEEFQYFKKNLDNEIKIGSNSNKIIDTDVIKNINEENINLQSYTPISTMDNNFNIEIHEYSKMNNSINIDNGNNSEITNSINNKINNFNNTNKKPNFILNKDQIKPSLINNNILNKKRNYSDKNPEKAKYNLLNNNDIISNINSNTNTNTNNNSNSNNETNTKNFIKSINIKNGNLTNEQKQSKNISPKNLLDLYNKNLHKANNYSGGNGSVSVLSNHNFANPKKKLSITSINEQKSKTNKINTSELTGITSGQNTNSNSRISSLIEIKKINSLRKSSKNGKIRYFKLISKYIKIIIINIILFLN
jgi:hypothetical protein